MGIVPHYKNIQQQPSIMKTFVIAALFLAAVVVSQPVYDETKDLHCTHLFPDVASYAHSRLNETLVHLEGAYFALLDPIDKELQSVVMAEATACLHTHTHTHRDRVRERQRERETQ